MEIVGFHGLSISLLVYPKVFPRKLWTPSIQPQPGAQPILPFFDGQLDALRQFVAVFLISLHDLRHQPLGHLLEARIILEPARSAQNMEMA